MNDWDNIKKFNSHVMKFTLCLNFSPPTSEDPDKSKTQKECSKNAAAPGIFQTISNLIRKWILPICDPAKHKYYEY